MSKELENEIEDLTIHLADMLEATLYYAGVKENNIEKAVKAYIDSLDDVFEDDDGEMGYKEIIHAIDTLKKSKPELF
jgi:hypothetical protein